MTQLNLPGGQCYYLNRAVSDIDGLHSRAYFAKNLWLAATQSGAAVSPTLDWLSRILVVDAACVAKGPPRIIKNSKKTISLDTRPLRNHSSHIRLTKTLQVQNNKEISCVARNLRRLRRAVPSWSPSNTGRLFRSTRVPVETPGRFVSARPSHSCCQKPGPVPSVARSTLEF